MVAYADGPRVSSILRAWNLPRCQFHSLYYDVKRRRKKGRRMGRIKEGLKRV
jgi:hypothetical protein